MAKTAVEAQAEAPKATTEEELPKKLPLSINVDFMGRQFYFEKKDDDLFYKSLCEKQGEIKEKHDQLLKSFKSLVTEPTKEAIIATKSAAAEGVTNTVMEDVTYSTKVKEGLVQYYSTYIEDFVDNYLNNPIDNSITQFYLHKLPPIIIDNRVKEIIRRVEEEEKRQKSIELTKKLRGVKNQQQIGLQNIDPAATALQQSKNRQLSRTTKKEAEAETEKTPLPAEEPLAAEAAGEQPTTRKRGGTIHKEIKMRESRESRHSKRDKKLYK